MPRLVREVDRGSGTTAANDAVTVGTASSLRIVQVPVARLRVSPPDGLLNTTVKISSASPVESVAMGTEMVCVATLAPKVSVPLVVVKSEPAVAVPLWVV